MLHESAGSGLFYANKFARITLNALEEVMGKNGLNAILNLAQLGNLIDNYPADNLEKGFAFHDFTAINLALETMYGPRGGRGLALRAGRATFSEALKNFGGLAGVGDLAFKTLPLNSKIYNGLVAMAHIFSTVSDQYSSAQERHEDFLYTIHRCPICANRHGTQKPVCFLAVGLLQEGLRWVSGGLDFPVKETKCSAMGDDVCEFTIPKSPA